MKSVLLSIFLLLSAFIISKAQDIVIMKSGDEVQAKVLEINPDNIKYKRFDNPDGPIITVYKSDVSMIKYQNGTKEIIAQKQDYVKKEGNTNAGKARGGRFAVCFDYGLSGGTGSYEFNYAIGGALRGELNLSTVAAFTFSAGYMHYAMKDYVSTTSQVTSSMLSIPLLIGCKFYAKELQKGFYGLLQFGLTPLDQTSETTSHNPFYPSAPSYHSSYATTVTTFGAGMGAHLDNIDLGFNYILMNINSVNSSSLNMLQLRLAFVFGKR